MLGGGQERGATVWRSGWTCALQAGQRQHSGTTFRHHNLSLCVSTTVLISADHKPERCVPLLRFIDYSSHACGTAHGNESSCTIQPTKHVHERTCNTYLVKMRTPALVRMTILKRH